MPDLPEERFVSAVCSASAGLNAFSSAPNQKAVSDFRKAGFEGRNLENYLTGSLFLSLLVFAVAAPLALLGWQALDAFALSLAGFGCAFLALSFLPKLLASRMAARIESELPFLLREFAIYLEIGMPFEECLAAISKRDYCLSSRLSSALQQMRSGSSVQEALSRISSESGSVQLKRSMFLLCAIYETGGSAEQLKRMAEGLSDMQLSYLRLQGGRLALFSVLFVAASALLPAFFCILAAVSPFFGQPMEEWVVWLCFLFAFPLLYALVLAAMLLALPPALGGGPPASGLEGFLSKRGFPYGRKAFALSLAAASALPSLLALLLGLSELSVLLLCLAPCAYSLASYLSQRDYAAAEASLPDALHSAASVHKVMSPEKMLSFLSRGGYWKLSEAFDTALRRQKAGEGFASSMEHALPQCRTLLTKRAFGLLVVSYETGADMGLALREAAADAASFFSLLRERAAAMAVQHYTLLAASSLLVPFILGTVLSMVPSISQSASISGLGGQGGGVFGIALACQLYLAACAVFSSLALSVSSGQSGRWPLYLSLIAPLSQAVFALASKGASALLAG